ncbi:hypothetical protein KIN20_007733 [Parelaphostrongylus tenuis]|uniref:Uncharacterized protein n=1 Tax=Parelaphostrongylus tenuis TaxID=148309 RepID=A0AAD5MLT3_PARTN|nr:hypothetical protein KIN20_007733 [Parelaphostrongylus tenuis]
MVPWKKFSINTLIEEEHVLRKCHDGSSTPRRITAAGMNEARVDIPCKLRGERRRLRYGRTATQRRYARNGPTTMAVERLQLTRAGHLVALLDSAFSPILPSRNCMCIRIHSSKLCSAAYDSDMMRNVLSDQSQQCKYSEYKLRSANTRINALSSTSE